MGHKRFVAIEQICTSILLLLLKSCMLWGIKLIFSKIKLVAEERTDERVCVRVFLLHDLINFTDESGQVRKCFSNGFEELF